MDEIKSLLNSMQLAVDEREKHIKSLEEKNKRLSIEIERMVKEKNIHQNQFIECHKRLNDSNDLVRKLENIINPLQSEEEIIEDGDFPDDLSTSSSDSSSCPLFLESDSSVALSNFQSSIYKL